MEKNIARLFVLMLILLLGAVFTVGIFLIWDQMTAQEAKSILTKINLTLASVFAAGSIFFALTNIGKK